MKKWLATAAAALVLSGCASGYSEFYRAEASAETTTKLSLLTPGQEPQLVVVDNLQPEFEKALSKGYFLIGQSAFVGRLQGEYGAIDQAKKIGATYILLAKTLVDSQLVTTPIYMPTSSTTYSSGTVYNGYGAANYTGTSTTYGTTAIPFTTRQDRYDQTALYMAKIKDQPKIGVMPVDLTPEQRKEIGRNTGAYVRVVLDDSPAFIANIVQGDVITAINGAPVISAQNALNLIAALPSGKTATFTVSRKGTIKDIEITPR